MCVCVRERERERLFDKVRVYVCVCVKEKEREIESGGDASPSVILLSRRDNGSHGLRFNVFPSLITFLLIRLNIL